MANKQQNPKYTTPKGVAKYPWLNTPSTAFNKNEYKTGLLLKVGDIPSEEFLELINDLVEQSYQKAVADLQKEGKVAAAKQVKKRFPYKEELDKETGEETGYYEFNFSTQAETKEGKARKVKLFDAQAKPINSDEVKVGGGSEIKVNFTASPYYMAASKEAGVKLYLNAVQIIKLVEFGNGGSASDFGFSEEYGGYAYENEFKATDLGANDDEDF